jgi:TorA maturation chaperone TorD
MELFRALGVLAEPPGAETRILTRTLGIEPALRPEDHTELFLLQVYPYASIYLGEEGMLGGEARDRIAGFWRAIGATPPPEPDHLAVMLALYAELRELELAESDPVRRAAQARARRTYLWEHLLTWLPAYLDKVQEIAPPTYRVWASLLQEALLVEAGEEAQQPDPPRWLVEAPGIPHPDREEARAVLSGVLSPLRSGMVLARADLVRAAEALGLGLRSGERRFMLEALMGQDPVATLKWLRQEALTWAGRHETRTAELPALGRVWAARARATADSLSLNSQPSRNLEHESAP